MSARLPSVTLNDPVTVRYWDVTEGEPFPAPNSDETDPYSPLFYLKRALGWLDELGMKGLIDLHAGPGKNWSERTAQLTLLFRLAKRIRQQRPQGRHKLGERRLS